MIHVLFTTRVRDRLETSVRVGDRGPQYIVVSNEDGSGAHVYPTCLPRRRSMRRCGLRSEMLTAFSCALPHTRPAGCRET